MANPFITALQAFTPEAQPVMASDEAKYRKMAELLRQQSMTPEQGQMVSGHYVAPSWTQHAAKLLGGWQAGRAERKADEAVKQGKKDFTDTAQKYADALRGREADTMVDPETGMTLEALPAQAGDPNKALRIAMQSNSPQWQQFAMQQQIGDAKGQNDTAEMRNYRFAQGLSPEERAQFMSGQRNGNTPSSIQEWIAFNDMSHQDQERYLTMKRANQIMNLGGTQAVRGQLGGIAEQYAVTPKPEDMPGFKGAQTAATEQAKVSIEKQSMAPKAKAAISSYEDKNKTLNSKIDSAKAQSSVWTTGFIGSVAQKIPGTAAFDLSRNLESIKANLGFAELQAMRDASPTGGALGNITERELSLLQSAWSNVEQAQSQKQFEKALDDVKAINNNALKRAREAYNQTYGAGGNTSRPPIDSLWGQ